VGAPLFRSSGRFLGTVPRGETSPTTCPQTLNMTTQSYAHHFSSANLPFGIASSTSGHEKPQAATRVGDSVIFLNDLAEDGLFSNIEGLPRDVFALDTLNDFAALPRDVHQRVRHALQALLEDGGLSRFPDKSVKSVSKVTMHMPVRVGDFSGRLG
jgi:fumarylacetoacetase